MDERLKELLEKARAGDEDAARTLATHLRRRPPEAAFLVHLAEADEESLRIAAALAARSRTDPVLLRAMRALSRDEADGVRAALAEAWGEAPDWPLPLEAAEALLADGSPRVRMAAAKGAAGRAPFRARLVALLGEDASWDVRLAAADSLGQGDPMEVLPELFRAFALDDDIDVARAALAGVETALGAGDGAWPEGKDPPPAAEVEVGVRRVEQLGSRRFPLATAWIDQRRAVAFDPLILATYGKDLTAEAEAGTLPRGYGLEGAVERVRGVLEGALPRAAVLLGEVGSGKTSLVHELVVAMAQDGWRVLQMSPSDFMAGTQYLGEWESKVEKLIKAIASPRKILLYIPNLHELSQAGVHSKSDRNVAAMLTPSIEAGTLTVLGESTFEAFRAGLGSQPALRRLFRALEIEPASEAATAHIAWEVCREAGVEAAAGDLERVRELGAFAAPASVEPGRTLGLLRDVLGQREEEGGKLEIGDVLETLSSITGVPLEMLDDARPLDLDEVQVFFESRVRGQTEAVRAMVDLVALIKAGLTDPGKPYGVYFFVGPTGVGKTELARALAERLFGDAGRLKRFDMSEYATFAAFERLIGDSSHPGLLTEAVRENPFAVFLFDEIEKAHVNVFDLCLQIFDAGRLTDGRGRTADYRHAIFLLTSNVGAAVPNELEVGFGGGTIPPPDAAATLRSLRHFFRPEFLGRIDRIVHFLPLAEGTAEWIARREVARVLERSGLARRDLVVDVDPGVVSFLLRQGYSPALGARPLKRTVERHVLLPVARALASGRVPPGAVLRLRARRDDVWVQVDAGEGEGAPPEEARATPEQADLGARVAALASGMERLRTVAATTRADREELLEESRGATFWEDGDRARHVLGLIHRWEGPVLALDVLGRRIRDTRRHLEKVLDARGVRDLSERVDALEREASQLAYVFNCREERDLADAYVTLARVRADAPESGGVEMLARMYVAFAARRGFDVEVVDDHRMEDPDEDTITLLVTGAGARGLLAMEAGLHQIVRPEAGRRGRSGSKPPRRLRELVRVEVFPVPEDHEVFPRKSTKAELTRLKGEKGRLLAKPKWEVALLHRGSMHAIRAWGKGTKDEAVATLLPLLAARVAAAGDAKSPVGVIRRYEFGPSPIVRDRRSGRQTGNLDRVLAGEIDLLRVLDDF